jgi:TonB-linked SusC/RagA family outer membrane protein
MNISKIIVFVLCLCTSFFVQAQQQVKVKGVVTGPDNETLSDVSIYQKNEVSGKGVVSNSNGEYEIVVAPNSVLIFSSVGYDTQEVTTGTATVQTINVSMEESAQQLEEVSIVGYGTQRKVSVIGAISQVKTSELQLGSISSVSNTLAGRIAGLIGIQSSGEPGSDVSEFWVRGISTFGGGSSALVLIDGIDRGTSGLNDLAPQDIESFSVLKDATATAVYGARGANGVIIINTKRGYEGKIRINADIKTSIETIPRLPEYLRAYDYALLANEAKVARGDLPVYSNEIFDIIRYNMDPDLYPDVNWQEEILRKRVYATQGNINISGGGKMARYYMSGFFRTNDAIYKQTGMEKYHSNVRRNQYSFRSNIDVDVTKSTRVSLLLSAILVDQNRPGIGNTSTIWDAVANITPTLVPVVYSNGDFPSYGQNNDASPYVLLNETGYQTNRDNTIESILNIEQNLGMLLDGLKITGTLSFDNFNNHVTRRYKMPDLYMAVDRNWQTGELMTTKTVVATPMSFSSSSYGVRTIYAEAKINYDKIIREKHRVGVLALYQQKDYQRTDIHDEILSIPKRSQGIAGRLTYSYDDIYFIEGNFGYNGSENFPKGQRFGLFPSVALGYVLSNYQYVQDNFSFINTLKLRYSIGLVGNDQINDNTRFPYLTKVSIPATGYYYGDVASYYSGATESVLGSTGLVWESAVKQNWGIDLLLWNAFNLTVDVFIDKRNNIFMERKTIPGTMGVSSTVWGNVGKMKSWGSDGTASYTRKFGDFNVELRGNFTFTRDKIIDYDEVTPRYPYLGQKGMPNGTTRGLIALGLFKDENDIKNSPPQYGTLLPGDIKYQDINGDGKIDSYDEVPIGDARIPKVQYGIAGSVSWKGIDFSIFFRGSGKSDYFLGGTGFYPFANENRGNVLSIVNRQENRWTSASYSGNPATENPNARFPRLTYGYNSNNNRNSTFWLADASFLRLKTVEIGYALPAAWIEKLSMSGLRVSIIGDNLHVWDKVKLFDPEQASSNGAVYPLTRSYTLVLRVSF